MFPPFLIDAQKSRFTFMDSAPHQGYKEESHDMKKTIVFGRGVLTERHVLFF